MPFFFTLKVTKKEIRKLFYSKGFSTIEILIAMALMIVVLTAITLLSYGNQNFLITSQANQEALGKAEEILEKAKAESRKDFRMVNPTPATTDGYYTTSTTVSRLSPTDYLSKLVTSIVSWQDDSHVQREVKLSALLTDFENAIGGDTCDSFLTGDWSNPKVTEYEFGRDLLQDNTNIFPISDIDAYKEKLFIVTDNSSTNTSPTFFQLDISNPNTPVFISKIDTDPTSKIGLNSIAVTDTYVYVANAKPSNFNTCVTPACGQLQIIDLQTTPPTVIKTFKISGVTGSGGQAVGNTIFYKNGLVYIGLSKTGGGPEFNIIDVSNPLNPVYKGGYSLGYGVNDIIVRNTFAYLAHPTDSFATAPEQVTILDITDPTNISRVSGYKAPDLQGHGRSIFTVGDTLYLGRTFTSTTNNEFYVLDNTYPANLKTNNSNTPQPSGYKINSSVGALLVRDYLVFILKGTSGSKPGQLDIVNISNPTTITQYAPSIPLQNASVGISNESMDCEGNYIYISSVPASGMFKNKGSLSIITAQ